MAKKKSTFLHSAGKGKKVSTKYKKTSTPNDYLRKMPRQKGVE